MAHLPSNIGVSHATILRAHRINGPTHSRLRSQARTGPIEGKAWSVVDALYATVAPVILRNAMIFAESRLGKRAKMTSACTIKEEDLIAAMRQLEHFPIELDTHGGMSSSLALPDAEAEPDAMDLDDEEKEKKQRKRAAKRAAKEAEAAAKATAAAASASDE
jgi:hypothetical protein